METLGKRFYVNFLVFAHWFVSISITKLKDQFVSVDQARYATSVVAKYVDTVIVKTSKTFYKTTITSDVIFTKDDVSTSDEQVEKLNRYLNINYIACIV